MKDGIFLSTLKRSLHIYIRTRGSNLRLLSIAMHLGYSFIKTRLFISLTLATWWRSSPELFRCKNGISHITTLLTDLIWRHLSFSFVKFVINMLGTFMDHKYYDFINHNLLNRSRWRLRKAILLYKFTVFLFCFVWISSLICDIINFV